MTTRFSASGVTEEEKIEVAMSPEARQRVPAVLKRNEAELLEAWVARQGDHSGAETELRRQSREVLAQLQRAVESDSDDIQAPAWDDLRATLASISQSRARKGAKPAETANFVLSLKEPIFDRLREQGGADPAQLAEDGWHLSRLLDQLALWVMEAYQRAREDVIARQQQEVLELSTPVVKLWKGVLALPLIGTLDSERTQVVMETLLERISQTGSRIAIIDITGVPAVDTRVAQHLLQTVAAARLMGADCIISGVRPQIAQTIVHLGLVLQDVVTKSSLADAFSLALERLGLEVVEGHRA